MADEDLGKLKIEKSAIVYRARRKRPALVAAVILLVAVCSFLLYTFVINPVVEVEVATVSLYYPSQGFTLLNASGYVVAQRKAAVASKATGRLVWLGIEEGSRVKSGQVIARLEGEDVRAAERQAEANLGNARALLNGAKTELNIATLEFNRARELKGQGYISQAEYDSAEARSKRATAGVEGAEAAVRAAEAALESAKVAVEYTLIRAPFDAVVLTKDADVGDIVTPIGAAANAKAAVVTIADLSSLQVEADVAESNLEKVRVGQPCEVKLDALPDARFRGVVHMIVPTADRTKASVMVKVKFLDEDKRILPEMSAKVAFLERQVSKGEDQPKTGVNPASIATRGKGQVVFILQGDRVKEAPVKTGEKMNDLVDLLEGAHAGDRVVLNPPKSLRDGARVKMKAL
ncbi:MAG: efflux RND transporter periplasmic adaptor subunit [bacterium]